MKKKLALILSASLFILYLPTTPLMGQDDGMVSEEVFEIFKKEMRDSLAQVGQSIDNGNETLNAAKAYMESADRLQDRFLNMVGLLLSIAALLLSGLVVILYTLAVRRFEKKLEEKFGNQADQIARLVRTEASSMYIKKNARILFLHKSGTEEDESDFVKLRELISSEFENSKFSSLSNLKKLNSTFQNFLTNKALLKIVVMDDTLFAELPKTNEEGKEKAFTEESRQVLEEFFSKLNAEGIGFFNVGKTRFNGLDNVSYKGFSNASYSAYSNINNLLKFMKVAKGVES